MYFSYHVTTGKYKNICIVLAFMPGDYPENKKYYNNIAGSENTAEY